MLGTFTKHKRMMGIELLQFLEPTDILKLALTSSKMHKLVEGSNFNEVLFLWKLEFIEDIDVQKLIDFAQLLKVMVKLYG